MKTLVVGISATVVLRNNYIFKKKQLTSKQLVFLSSATASRTAEMFWILQPAIIINMNKNANGQWFNLWKRFNVKGNTIRQNNWRLAHFKKMKRRSDNIICFLALWEYEVSQKHKRLSHFCRRNLSRINAKPSSIAEFYEMENIRTETIFLVVADFSLLQ